MALKAGSVSDFENSMASAMADAFAREWRVAMNNQPFPGMNSQTKLIFAAVAQGVVNYLKANHDAFKVEVTGPVAGSFTGTVKEIQ